VPQRTPKLSLGSREGSLLLKFFIKNATKRSNFGFSVYRGVASMKKEKLWSKEPKTIAQGENKVRD